MAEDMQDTQDQSTSSETEGLKNLLARHQNDAMSLAADLYNQTYKLREDRRSLRDRVKELEKVKPPEDAVVLTGEEKEAYNRYKDLGAPEEIQQKFEEAKTSAREARILKMSSDLGFKDSVLRTLLGDKDIVIEDVETEDGQKKPVYKVQDGEEAVGVEKLLETKWSDFKPSLLTTGQEAPKSTPALGQPSSKRDSGEPDYVSSYLKTVNDSRTRKEV